jgi:hypothetical protein
MANKKHIPHPSHYPKINPKDGDIGWCGALWCEVAHNNDEITCKKCLKKQDKAVKEIQAIIRKQKTNDI